MQACGAFGSVISTKIGGYVDDALNRAGPSSIDYEESRSKIVRQLRHRFRARARYDGSFCILVTGPLVSAGYPTHVSSAKLKAFSASPKSNGALHV